MNILTATVLSEQQKSEIKQLESLVLSADNLQNTVVLSNELNFDTQIPCFFLLYDNSEFLAFLTVFMPSCSQAEVLGFTHPSHRRKGHFKQLFENALLHIKKAKIPEVVFAAEPNAEPALHTIKTYGELNIARSEYCMQTKAKVKLEGENALHFELITVVNQDVYKMLKDNIFEQEISGDNMLQSILTSPTRSGYIVYLLNEPIGVFNINKKDIAFINGLGLVPKYRGKGYGRYLLAMAVEQGLLHSDTVVLDVDSDNPPAFNLYQNSGFEIIGQVNYYKLPMKLCCLLV